MMLAAFGPVIPATSRVTVMLVYAEETPSDFAREVPEGTRYVVKSVAAHPPFPGTFTDTELKPRKTPTDILWTL